MIIETWFSLRASATAEQGLLSSTAEQGSLSSTAEHLWVVPERSRI